MYRSRNLRRRWGIGLAVATTAAALCLLLGYRAVPPQPGSAPRYPPTPHHGTPVAGASPRPASGYSPPRVARPGSPVQSQVDGELAQAEKTTLDPSVAALLPAAGDSTAYPAVPSADRGDPAAYAAAFVAELLDRDYRRQSRTQLLAWAQAESAPNTLPGVPAGLAPRSLVMSLVAPDGPNGPVPSSGQWTVLSANDTSQTVAGLQTQVDPDWVSLISTGWEPVDPAMTMLTVTGTLVTRSGAEQASQPFSLVLTVGSNASRPGCGAVAVDGWTVS